MKSKNDFIKPNKCFKDLQELLLTYKNIKEQHEIFLADYNKLNEYFNNEEEIPTLNGDSEIPRVEYSRASQKLNQIESILKEFLEDYFTFDNFGIVCEESKHYFVRTKDELKCLLCGASTKDYDLTEEELDMLTAAANQQGLVLENANQKDAPLLKVLLEKINEIKANAHFEELGERASSEEEYLFNISEMYLLDKAIEKAHYQDSKSLSNDDKEYEEYLEKYKFLTEKKMQEIMEDINSQIPLFEISNSRFKNLFIEECLTALYEVRILSGYSIPLLAITAESEDELIALTKAYYNLSNQAFRENSDYFAGYEWNADKYAYLTANEEINKRMISLKYKRQ